MTNAQRTHSIKTGFNLGQQLDQEIRRLNRSPIPAHWHDGLRSIRTINGIVAAIRSFDDKSDSLTRLLLDTPVGDAVATTVLVAGLLPGAIQRNRNCPDRVADVIAEVAIVVAERRAISQIRHAATACLDLADQRSSASVTNQHRYEGRTAPLPTGIEIRDTDDTEAIALLHIQVDKIRSALGHTTPGYGLEQVLEVSGLAGANARDRQRLSRQRRRIRPIVDSQLLEVA